MVIEEKTQIVYENILKKYINSTESTLIEGDVVAIDPVYSGAILHVKFPESLSDANVAGVVLATSRDGQPVYAIQFGQGKIKVDNSKGDITYGDRLVTKGGGNNTIAVKDSAINGAIVGVALTPYSDALPGLIEANIISPVGYGIGGIFQEIVTSGYVNAEFNELVWKQPVLYNVNYVSSGSFGFSGASGEKLLELPSYTIWAHDGANWNVLFTYSENDTRALFNLQGSVVDDPNRVCIRDNKIYHYYDHSFSSIMPLANWTVLNAEEEEIYSYNYGVFEWIRVTGKRDLTVETITFDSIASTTVPNLESIKMYLKKADNAYIMAFISPNGEETIIGSYLNV